MQNPQHSSNHDADETNTQEHKSLNTQSHLSLHKPFLSLNTRWLHKYYETCLRKMRSKITPDY